MPGWPSPELAANPSAVDAALGAVGGAIGGVGITFRQASSVDPVSAALGACVGVRLTSAPLVLALVLVLLGKASSFLLSRLWSSWMSLGDAIGTALSLIHI